MIVQPINRNVQVSDAMQRTRATMLASPEMLRRAILPYTKLELAAIRETINNAADSSTKLAIQIPTKLEPVVRIRDYGPGIPVAQIYNFYSVAGYSTKTQTNVTTDANGNEIHVMGCKGVGRFAPLGVTEQFTFHNYTAGRCIVGQVFFDSEGYPTVDILDDSESSEPSGVEISFAVDPIKIGEFRNAFHECLVNFPDHYEVQFLGEPIDVIKPQPKVSGSNWYLDDESGIIMGRIKYEVNAHEFISFSHQLYGLLNAGLVLRVPLGSIDVNDARESIVYNDRTKKAIQQAADVAVKEYQASLDAAFANVATEWEACLLFSQMTDNTSRQIFGNPKWKGKNIGAYVNFVVPKDNIVGISADSHRRRRRRSSSSQPLPAWLYPRGRDSKGTNYHIYPASTTIVLVDDHKQYVRKLTHAYEDPQSIIHQYLPLSGASYRGQLTIFVYDSNELQSVLDALGGARVTFKISDLPDPPAKPRQPKAQRVAAPIVPYVYSNRINVWARATTPVSTTDDTVLWCLWEDRKAYVHYDKTKHPTVAELYTKSGVSMQHQPATNVVRTLETIGQLGSRAIVALTKPLQAKVKNTKWRSLADYMEEALVAHAADPTVRRSYALLYAANKDGWDSCLRPFTSKNSSKYLNVLGLPDIRHDSLVPVSIDCIPKSWRDDDFAKEVKEALEDRPLFQYLAYNVTTPEKLIINYLKEGK